MSKAEVDTDVRLSQGEACSTQTQAFLLQWRSGCTVSERIRADDSQTENFSGSNGPNDTRSMSMAGTTKILCVRAVTTPHTR